MSSRPSGYDGPAVPKPPLGVIPRDVWKMHRLAELQRAIAEYASQGWPLRPEWVTEYNELRAEIIGGRQ